MAENRFDEETHSQLLCCSDLSERKSEVACDRNAAVQMTKLLVLTVQAPRPQNCLRSSGPWIDVRTFIAGDPLIDWCDPEAI